ncbi:MAG: flagellar basal body-associated protein FliL [Campylobacterales bacterium]|nr:flagellar basal body-associated protein FliL [Campylobacterales bacterium]
MATKEKTESKEKPEHHEEIKEKKSSNMLMIIIIVVLILIIVIGGVVAVLLMGGDEKKAAHGEAEPQAQEKPAEKAVEKIHKSVVSAEDEADDTRDLHEIGVLYPLETFTVNLKSDGGRRYLKVTMSLELEGKELAHELEKTAPVLRDIIIKVLKSKTVEEISSKKGTKKIADEIMGTLNAKIKDGKIKGIYFTEFVIQ